MMELSYLPINRENILYRPDRLAITLGDQQVIFRISWNPVAESFFFDLFDNEGDYILAGRRIVYAQDMLENIPDERVPGVQIIPLDMSGEADPFGITFENFMKSVKPYIVGDS